MIKLYQFPSCWGLPNASPFCMKVETYLRMVKLPYELVKVLDPRKAPKGKLPYIEDHNQLIADSSLIIEYLKKAYGDKLDANLTAEQKSQSILIQRTLEEHLYWCMLYSRWIDDRNWPETRRDYFAKVPALLRSFISYTVRKDMKACLHAEGVGRHSSAEIYKMGIDDLTAINTILSSQPFLLGDTPTSIDASGYAFIVNLIHVPTESPMNDYAKSAKCFTDYCQRMKALFF